MEEDELITREEREVLNEITDEQEQTYITQFYENEPMREAVKKILLIPLYAQGVLKRGKKARPGVNWAFSGLSANNENLGAMVRAGYMGINFLNRGFKILSTFKKEKVEGEKKTNEAR
jgi:hypothetical protein